ncbi:MAG: hypothetical protein OXI87_14725 [Albidovulum sp.]|nr:hypothetical protein [Albidovulum sp.]MDE0306112.1 hypothetical protein [Albidovulum sp.]MDE0531820.1 hypothetical protein [Albidovulum sp.]
MTERIPARFPCLGKIRFDLPDLLYLPFKTEDIAAPISRRRFPLLAFDQAHANSSETG